MKSKRAHKKIFAVLGKESNSLEATSNNWVKSLGVQADTNFSEISQLILKNDAGNPLGVWGLMNNLEETNKPWGPEGGKYLAGYEVPLNATKPSGWKKWIIEDQNYLVFTTNPTQYQKISLKR